MAGDMTSSISNWAGGGASVTLGAAQYFIGRHNDKKNKRPEYHHPGEIDQNLNQAQQQSLQGIPEEQKQQYLSNLERGSAFGLSQIGSRSGGLAGVAELNQGQNDAYAEMMSRDAGVRMQNQAALMNARQTMANYKDQEFQINKLNPYYENKSRDQAMMGAGMQNVSQGFQSSNSGTDWGGDGGGQKNMSPGKSYYTSDPNSPVGMKNYNPYSQNGSLSSDPVGSYNDYA